MKRLILMLRLVVSVVLLFAAIALSYISLMMGTLHWDWWLSAGLGIGFLALAVGAAWMCRQAYRSMKSAR